MAETYKGDNCGAAFNEPRIILVPDQKGGASTTVKETEQKCCPVCGTPQKGMEGDSHQDSIGRYD